MASRALAAALASAAGLILAGGAAARTVPGRAAPLFRVGAATANIDPTYPVYMGGYGGGPKGGTITRHINPLTGRPEHFTVRAIAIARGGHVVEFATVDTQGYFAGYQEGPYGISNVRSAVARYLRAHGAAAARPSDVIVSSEHEHASPTVIGIWGPASHQLPYLKEVASRLTEVLERAYQKARPATLAWGQGNAPWVADRVIAEGNAFEGWPRDGSIGTLWARDARTGDTIAVYATEPGYPNIVYGPGDMIGPDKQQEAVLSSDFPGYAEAYIERHLGGTAIITPGTLGNQTGPLQTDDAPSPDLPPQRYPAPGGHFQSVTLRQTRAFDDAIHMGRLIGNLVIGSLAHGGVIESPVLKSAQQYVRTPVDNPALVALDEAEPVGGEKLFATLTEGQIYPTDRSFNPPYGEGALLETWVTSFRIGNLLFTTMPGEFFPEIHAAWQGGIHGPAGNFVVGAAQDFLGYEYPAYAFPFTLEGSDEHIFNPSVTLGDQVVTAGEQDAAALGFRVNYTSNAEVSALQNKYLRAFKPGVQVLAFPNAGDLASDGAGFTATLEGVSQAARVSSTGACVADPLGPCPLPPAPVGGFHWRFGDGTAAVTPPQVFVRAWYSPFLHHRYCSAGVYRVTVSGQDRQGRSDSMTLPIHVYPALGVRIVRHGRRAAAVASGGDGVILAYRWTINGRRHAYTRVIDAPRGAQLRVTVADAAGGTARYPQPASAQPSVARACRTRAGHSRHPHQGHHPRRGQGHRSRPRQRHHSRPHHARRRHHRRGFTG